MKRLTIFTLFVLLIAQAAGAERLRVTCSFDLPCEVGWGRDSVIFLYRDVETYTAVVDRLESPYFMQEYDNELFRFVLLVDMRENQVIATSYDRFSRQTFQMEIPLKALCSVPMKGTLYIPLTERPSLCIHKADLRLDELQSATAERYRSILAELGMTSEDLPNDFQVTRQGVTMHCTAELLPAGSPQEPREDSVL
jgi:hypothetical protein